MKYIFATVALILIAPISIWADPGESTSISVCQQHQSFQLIDALNGSPTPGGQWTDPDQNVLDEGIFAPSTSAAGIYTYTVDAGDGPESSTVEIALVNCLGTPANDDCFNAQFINPASGIPFTTLGATTDGLPHFGEENCEINGQAQIENDVWFFYVAGCNGNSTISTVGGTQLDTKIAVYNFNCPPTTADMLACNDNFGSSYQSALTYPVTMNGVYLIRIGESPGPGSGNGTFNLIEICEGEEAPENELCQNAFEISPDEAIPFSTFNAFTDGPDHAGDATCVMFEDDIIHNDVWFSYTATCDGQVTMSTLSGTTLDTRVAIYLDECPQDLSGLIACNDDFQGFAQSVVTWDILQGEQYTIRVGNSSFSNGGSGTFSLLEICGEEPPANDHCIDAQTITPALGIPFNTFNATTDGPSHFNNPTCAFFGGSQIEKDVWYKYTAGCDGIAEMSTVGGTFLDTRLAVYAAQCPGNDLLNLIVCNDDDGSLQSTVTWTVVQGDMYYVRLGEFPGTGGGSGTFDLIETCMEVCATPVIGFQPYCTGIDDFDGFFVSATVFSAGNSGPYIVSSDMGGDEQEISVSGVYTFGPYSNSEEVFFNMVSTLDETCMATSFNIGYDCYPDNLNFNCIDADQVFENQYFSYTLENAVSSDTISNIGCGFNEIFNELWYFYTAPCTGAATWTNCAFADVSTRMVVYNNSCENEDLEFYACSEPADCSEFSSEVTFATFQGVTYVMRIGSASVEETGVGVFIIEQEINLVSAGADTTLFFCSGFNGAIVLTNYLQGAGAGGEWIDDDESGALIGNTLFFNSLTAPGVFHYSYQVQGDCNTDVSTITINYDICDNVQEQAHSNFVLFPNPARDVVRVKTNNHHGMVNMIINDLSGRQIMNHGFNSAPDHIIEVDLSGYLKSGMYIVKLTDMNTGLAESHRLIFQN